MILDRDQTESHLNDDAADARSRIKRALLSWENSRRRESQSPELPASTVIWLPTGRDADLRLLTLVVWSVKYCVSLEWLLGVILTRLKYRRRLPGVKSPEELSLGLPAAVLVGADARAAVEERLAAEFPMRENVLSARQIPAPPMPDLPACVDPVASYRSALADAARPRKSTAPGRAYRRGV